jgi:hypothetical protein
LKLRKGQIAHLDRDRTNNAADNLAWMCLSHHDQYDIQASQAKGITLGEVKVARLRLYEAIALGEHWEGGKPLDKAIAEIMEFLGDTNKRPALGPEMLRFLLHDKIGDLAEWWFRRGFSRGHKESYKAYSTQNIVPCTITYECSRNVSPGQNRRIDLKHTIKEKDIVGRKKGK